MRGTGPPADNADSWTITASKWSTKVSRGMRVASLSARHREGDGSVRPIAMYTAHSGPCQCQRHLLSFATTGHDIASRAQNTISSRVVPPRMRMVAVKLTRRTVLAKRERLAMGGGVPARAEISKREHTATVAVCCVEQRHGDGATCGSIPGARAY